MAIFEEIEGGFGGKEISAMEGLQSERGLDILPNGSRRLECDQPIAVIIQPPELQRQWRRSFKWTLRTVLRSPRQCLQAPCPVLLSRALLGRCPGRRHAEQHGQGRQ